MFDCLYGSGQIGLRTVGPRIIGVWGPICQEPIAGLPQVVGKLGPEQLGPRQSGPGQLGPGAQFTWNRRLQKADETAEKQMSK